MTAAGFTLTVPNLSLTAAHALSDLIDAGAITLNETAEGDWLLVAYFHNRPDAEAARANLPLEAAVIARLPDTDWIGESLRGLAPVTAGRFFLHGVHDRHRRRAGGISLEIDAATAFGTGHHGSTEGCLLALDRMAKRRTPRRVLDVGCGTGVLAIAAARTWRTKSVASDIDPEAVQVTSRNASGNGVGPSIRAIRAAGLKHLHIRAVAPYDLIFANILARPLANLAQAFSMILARGGVLVLSGLTVDQRRWIVAAYRNRGLLLANTITRGNWATLLLRKPRISGVAGGVTQNRFGLPSRRRRQRR